MHGAGGCSAYHHGDRDTSLGQLTHGFGHFRQRWGYKSRQAYGIWLIFQGSTHDVFRRYHYTQVYDLVAVASHHHGNDVLAYVVHVALHRGKQHLALTLLPLCLLGLYVWLKNTYGTLHRAGGLHHLGQEHLAFAEETAHTVHTLHERTFNNVHSPGIQGESLIEVGLETVGYSLLQLMGKPFFHRHCLYSVCGHRGSVICHGLAVLFLLGVKFCGQFNQCLAGLRGWP